jgi:hypothetical protein
VLYPRRWHGVGVRCGHCLDYSPPMAGHTWTLKFWCCAKDLASARQARPGSNDFARARQRLPVIRCPRKRRLLHSPPTPPIVGALLLYCWCAPLFVHISTSTVKLQACLRTFAASLVVGPPRPARVARARRKKMRYVCCQCIGCTRLKPSTTTQMSMLRIGCTSYKNYP